MNTSAKDRFCVGLDQLCQSKEFVKPFNIDVDAARSGLNDFFGLAYKKDNERFYSEVLKGFLDPNGKCKDGAKFLSLFVRYLKSVAALKGKKRALKILENIEKSGSFEDVSVTTDQGRVDVLIRKGNEWAIVIENKICGETDQKHQVPRYFDAQGTRECVAVYLKAYEDDAMPVDTDFSEADKRNMRNYLLPVAGVLGQGAAEFSLLDGWARACSEVTADKKVKKALGWFMDLLRYRADGVFNLKMAPAVVKLMGECGITYGMLSEIKKKASEPVRYLIESVELNAFQDVARRSKRIGKFSLGALHDRGEKMVLFMHDFLDGNMVLVLDVKANELSFNIRRNRRVAVSIDDYLPKLFGSAVVRIRNNRYGLPVYDNATIGGMIASAEKLLKVISGKESELETILRKL